MNRLTVLFKMLSTDTLSNTQSNPNLLDK